MDGLGTELGGAAAPALPGNRHVRLTLTALMGFRGFLWVLMDFRVFVSTEA